MKNIITDSFQETAYRHAVYDVHDMLSNYSDYMKVSKRRTYKGALAIVEACINGREILREYGAAGVELFDLDGKFTIKAPK